MMAHSMRTCLMYIWPIVTSVIVTVVILLSDIPYLMPLLFVVTITPILTVLSQGQGARE